MNQGEIWHTNLNPVKGSEQSGMRPAVIVSGSVANIHLNAVICCPLTTKVKNYKGKVVLKPNISNKLTKASEILTFHICSISKARLVRKIGVISKEELQQIRGGFDDIWRY